MKAAVFQSGGGIGVLTQQQPEPGPGQVRLGITAAGICGSDLHIKHGALGDPAGIQPGHEIAGIVDAVGDGVSITTGTHVAVEPIVACNSCHFCYTARGNLCADHEFIGIALPGGLTEYILVPESLLYRLPQNLNKSSAALSEPMAVCVRGARIARVGIGDRVAIIGAGSIGLLSILAAKQAGAGEVLITARHPHQQELALALGADKVFQSAEHLLSEIGDQHADIVIETVGGEGNTLDEAVRITRSAGRIAVLGLFQGSPAIPGMAFFQKELTIAASNCYSRESTLSDFYLGTQLATQHADLITPLVTHTFSLDEVDQAFAVAEDKSTRSIKVQIHY